MKKPHRKLAIFLGILFVLTISYILRSRFIGSEDEWYVGRVTGGGPTEYCKCKGELRNSVDTEGNVLNSVYCKGKSYDCYWQDNPPLFEPERSEYFKQQKGN